MLQLTDLTTDQENYDKRLGQCYPGLLCCSSQEDGKCVPAPLLGHHK